MMTLAELTKAHKDAAKLEGHWSGATRTARLKITSTLVPHPHPAHADRASLEMDAQVVVEVKSTGVQSQRVAGNSITWQEARKRALAQVGLECALGRTYESHAGPLPKKVRVLRTDKHQPNFGMWYGSKLADLVEKRQPSRSAVRRQRRAARRQAKGLPA